MAAIPPAGDERARTAFTDFVTTWMAKLEATEARNRNNHQVQSGASKDRVTFRGFGDDISTELRPTGHPTAPYIGILRYSEQVHRCSDGETANCSVTSSVPVTEIFRYQGGRWVY
jgi:hypothetical protein